jgi:hypothetical protein
MATYYVYSAAAGTGTGASWVNAYTTLTTALSGKAAGDVIYVAHDHAESTAASITLSVPGGTIGNPIRIVCVNRAGSVPPVSADLRTTATVSTTGASNITISGVAYWYGIQFQAGSAANTANILISQTANNFYSNCVFKLNNTSTSSLVQMANTAGSNSRLEACSFVFGNASQTINENASSVNAGNVVIIGGSIAATGTVPTTAFTLVESTLTLSGVDLSALGSGKTLFAGNVKGRVRIDNCKLGSSVTVSGGTTSTNNWQVVLVNSDSTTNNYRYEKYMFAGAETTETTIVRTGGATDGTTSFARKIVTNSSANWYFPFESEPLAIWNDTTGSATTITVYGIWGGGAVPNNDELWMEVRYLGSSATPISSVTTTTKADFLASAAALTSDSSTWGGSTTKFKMTASVTPQMKGPILVIIKAAKASSTFYYDPSVSVT